MGPDRWGPADFQGSIVDAAEHRFGRNTRPSAIIMAHGHLDQAGSLEALARHWDVPVYAYPLEFPYLNGQASYPPADPPGRRWPDGDVVPLFPRAPVNVEPWLEMLPADQTVPAMPQWRWLHTPGHAPGHVSLWRAADRTLISGDEIVTTGEESLYEAITQTPKCTDRRVTSPRIGTRPAGQGAEYDKPAARIGNEFSEHRCPRRSPIH